MFKDCDFKKSTFSPIHIDASCVEVAIGNGKIAVRDTKDANKSTLHFTPKEWDAFVKGVKAGEFDL